MGIDESLIAYLRPRRLLSATELQIQTELRQGYIDDSFWSHVETLQTLEQMPDHAGLHYNYACLATLAGDTSDETFTHLRRSVELRPGFRDSARHDDDLAALRDDPRFEQALS